VLVGCQATAVLPMATHMQHESLFLDVDVLRSHLLGIAVTSLIHRNEFCHLSSLPAPIFFVNKRAVVLFV